MNTILKEATDVMSITMYEPELGKMVEVIQKLDSSPTKREFKKNELSLKGFLNSIQGMRNLPRLTAWHRLAYISRTSFFNLGCIQYCFVFEKPSLDNSVRDNKENIGEDNVIV